MFADGRRESNLHNAAERSRPASIKVSKFASVRICNLDRFLENQTWKPSIRKEDMMRQLRTHMHGGELFSSRLPKIISELMSSKQDHHLRPDVERTATLMMEERELSLKSNYQKKLQNIQNGQNIKKSQNIVNYQNM